MSLHAKNYVPARAQRPTRRATPKRERIVVPSKTQFNPTMTGLHELEREREMGRFYTQIFGQTLVTALVKCLLFYALLTRHASNIEGQKTTLNCGYIE